VGAPTAARWESIDLEEGFRADLIVEAKVIVEVTSVEAIAPVHAKRRSTYLKLPRLLINSNVELIRGGVQRLVNRLPE